ncbi:protein FAR1-RELATED SEQUENCE 5-like [Arachis stenosperma]|uniref:protein FAR1-RELATED SEQUENCE 5-like n=1 Tax=Arachis stenosperma TaxID=217475 RepID=UPI0025AD0472|nr:protein FAR1-RELATED SEQUENCE 5-like [Arachis stenosperma]
MGLWPGPVVIADIFVTELGRRLRYESWLRCLSPAEEAASCSGTLWASYCSLERRWMMDIRIGLFGNSILVVVAGFMGTTNKMCDNDDACQENAYTRNGSKNVDEDTTHNTTESEFFYRDMGEFGDVEGIDVEDIMKKVFRSDEDAYEFYKKFGKYHGFGVRKGDSWKDEDGIVTRRRFFCNRQGLRDEKHYNRVDRMRVHKPETRTNCEAKFSIYLDRSASVWRVRKIENKHNHDLTPSCMVHLIAKYRSLTDAAKAQVDGLNEYGISTAKSVRYMAGMAGGYSLVGFLKKDAYNHIDKRRRVMIAEGDADAALAYLEGKTESDPMAMARYSLTNKGMLGNMFWADGGSRVDYQYFGDVLVFDATYKKNKYRRPLVIFSGANNHKQTTIFGFGLLMDETFESYKWILENMLEVMCMNEPSVVVTDGDEAMRKAITLVFPKATHRLCAWHFQKNSTANVKEPSLRSRFNRWLYADIDIREFLTEWDLAVEEFKLQDSLWARQVFGKKEMWVNAYLKNKFCAGFRTTSRCEGINAVVKNFLQSKHTILELVQNLEVMVRDYQNNELLAQFRTIDTFPVMTTSLDAIERFAALTYTKEVFADVKREIERVTVVNLVRLRRSLNMRVYSLEEYGSPGRVILVLFDRNMGRLKCRCDGWTKYGYPCRHLFFVMKHEHLQEIPEQLIMKQWTKNAKALEEYVEKTNDGGDRSFLLRHGALHTACCWLFFLGAQQFHLFGKAMKGIRELCRDLERECGHAEEIKHTKGERKVIRDPVRVRTKGAPKVPKGKSNGRERKCTKCKNTGHTKRKCLDAYRVRLDEMEQDKLPVPPPLR